MRRYNTIDELSHLIREKHITRLHLYDYISHVHVLDTSVDVMH